MEGREGGGQALAGGGRAEEGGAGHRAGDRVRGVEELRGGGGVFNGEERCGAWAGLFIRALAVQFSNMLFHGLGAGEGSAAELAEDLLAHNAAQLLDVETDAMVAPGMSP